VSVLPTNGPSTTRVPTKNLREKEADSYYAALAGILAAGLAEALEAGDHEAAVGFINRGLAEGTPQLGCDLLHQAMTTVGGARTWTVRIAPAPRSDRRSSAAQME
jgi:hypothetical protein